MKAIIILGLSFLLTSNVAFAIGNELSYELIDNLNSDQKVAIRSTFDSLTSILPAKFIEGLPIDIKIKFEKLQGTRLSDINLCEMKEGTRFQWGAYTKLTNTLVLNKELITILQTSPEDSVKINCFHGSMYNQVISTILHELMHAYDFNTGYPSSSKKFLSLANFKKGMLTIKNKNVTILRSPDEYESENNREYFAVNFEYFLLDEEYACRRPGLFNYYKNLFNFDAFPNRKCAVGKYILLSSAFGILPLQLDIKRVYQIDYFLASVGSGIISGFGHSMFRIVVCAPDHYDPLSKKIIPATPFGPDCLKDTLFHLVISFRANIVDPKMSMMKGLTGGYPSMLFMFGLEDIIKEYNNDELRDLTAYPLKLNRNEIKDFLYKTSEANWGYKGDFKFITNNCAVESIELLKSSVENKALSSEQPKTPYSALEDMITSGIIQSKDSGVQVFPSKTSGLLKSLNTAYGIKNASNKDNNGFLRDILERSSLRERIRAFDKFSIAEQSNSEEQRLLEMRDRQQKISSSYIIEKQIIHMKYASLQKTYTDFLLKKEEKKKFKKSAGEDSSISKSGYGIPLDSEVTTADEVYKKIMENPSKAFDLSTEEKLKFRPETDEIANIGSFITKINLASANLRSSFRKSLYEYAEKKIQENVVSNAELKALLINNDPKAITFLREKMNADLVSENEITNLKLFSMTEKYLDNKPVLEKDVLVVIKKPVVKTKK